jgi:hypothetical protein
VCLIVDANALSLTLDAAGENDFTPVWTALMRGRARAVYGGELAREYARVAKLRDLIVQLDRAGRMRQVDSAAVDAETTVVESEQCCASDDPHIIALARVSQVRLLCSHDKALHTDFTNPNVLRPRGSIYQRPEHEPLIAEHCKSLQSPRNPTFVPAASRPKRGRKR